MFGVFLPLFRESQGVPLPGRFRWLATGVSDLRVERIDARSLKITPDAGFWSNSSQLILRDPKRPLAVGERVELHGVSFEVLSHTADERPLDEGGFIRLSVSSALPGSRGRLARPPGVLARR